MKRNAIARIVIYSILIIALLGVLGTGFAVDRYLVYRNEWTQGSGQSFSGESSNTCTFEADSIHEIEVEWAAGTIHVVPGDTEQIRIEEYCTKDSARQMVCKQSGNTLLIQYGEEFDWNGVISFGINIDYSKDLTITVPRDWSGKSVHIESASAQLEINDLTLREVEIDAASGLCRFTNCNIDELSLETVSGDIHYTGNLQRLSCSAVSANCSVEVTNSPESIEMEGVSGNLDLTLPQDCGFSARIETVSGQFHSEFETTTQHDTYIYGDGSCHIEMEGVSGDIDIRKG